jgi:prepilin-type N-terminal cleavage/methylation domain-containing protein
MTRLRETNDTKRKKLGGDNMSRILRPTAAYGFTLVELLVVIFVMALIATVGGDVIISTLRSSNKANIINEINQNANFVLSSVESVIRNAKSVQILDSPTNRQLEIIDQYNQKNGFCLKTVLVSGSTVGVMARSSDGCVTTTNLTNANPVNGVSVYLGAATPPVPSPAPTVSSFQISGTNPPLVTVTLTLRQGPAAPGRIDYNATSTFTKSIELRKY